VTDASSKGSLARRLTWLALALSLGGVTAALIAALGSAVDAWSFGAGLGALRYALYAALAGGVLAIVAFVLSRRSGARTGWLNGLALAVSLLFVAYLGNQVATARTGPVNHDAATDLDDLPQ